MYLFTGKSPAFPNPATDWPATEQKLICRIAYFVCGMIEILSGILLPSKRLANWHGRQNWKKKKSDLNLAPSIMETRDEQVMEDI